MQLDYKDIIIKHYVLSMSGSEIARQIGFSKSGEYSCAVTPQIRQMGNHLSGNAGTAYASLLA